MQVMTQGHETGQKWLTPSKRKQTTMLDIIDSIFIKKYFTLSGRASRREYWVGQFIFWALHAGAASLSLFIFKNFSAPPKLHAVHPLGIQFVVACFVFSLPTYLWRHAGLLIVGFIAAFVGLAIMPLHDFMQFAHHGLTSLSKFIRPVAWYAAPVLLTTLFLLLPSIALTVRRFHDRGLPGFTLFFIPEILGLIIDLLSGSSKPNRFGNPPEV